MTVLVAVTDNNEGRIALELAGSEAERLDAQLVVMNFTQAELDLNSVPDHLLVELVVPDASVDDDEVAMVLAEIESRPSVTRLVVGVRGRSPVGKALLGSLPQRLILQSPVPVLSVRHVSRFSR